MAGHDLDDRGTAAYLTGREGEAVALWSAGYESSTDPVAAARFGIRLANAFAFKGDVARSSGWVERVRRSLIDVAECAEHAWLEQCTGMLRIFIDGDLPAALECFLHAGSMASRFGDEALQALARIGEGRCRIYLGELARGLSLLDEAMLSVEDGRLPAMTVGDAYCTVIDATYELFDLRRTEAWTESFTDWCDAQPGLVLYRGNCLLHRAEILQLHGKWPDAVAFAQEACKRLAEPVNLMTLGGAHYVEADLRRLQNDLTGAERGYERAHEHGCDPYPGLLLLKLEQGRAEDAAAGMRRLLAQSEDPISRAKLLPAAVEILRAAHDADGAKAAASQLDEVAEQLASELLRAHAAACAGAVVVNDDAAAALAPLRRGLRSWLELDVPYEAARTRLLIADACEALGDRDGAALERKSAHAVLAKLRQNNVQPVHGLTSREVEVFALLAQGKSNRAISEELFVSEKTVITHVSHIFSKLGVSSRSAATAYAHEHNLV